MFWKIVMIICFAIAFGAAAIGAYNMLRFAPFKALKVIKKARENGCQELAKRTCFLLEGEEGNFRNTCEYMYIVDGKPYFITYVIGESHLKDAVSKYLRNDPERLNPLTNSLIFVYYDKDNPANAYSKYELFCPRYYMKRVKTPKDNPARDISIDWIDPIYKR